MYSNVNFNVLFWLKKTAKRPGKTVPIYARIRVNGGTVDLSTKLFVLQKNWNSRAKRIRTDAENANAKNFTLNKIEEKLEKSFKQLLEEGHWVTAKLVKMRFLGKDNRVTTCQELMAYHRKHELHKLAPGTAKNYGATEKYIFAL